VLLGFGTPSAVCFLGRWYVYRFADYIDKPDLAASICKWNCPNDSVRRSIIGKKWLVDCLIRLALNFGTCLNLIRVKPIRISRASSQIAASALECREAHKRAIWQELKEANELFAYRDWHEPRMKPTIWALNRDRRLYVTGRDNQGTPHRPAMKQVLRLGANLVGFLIVPHG